MKNTKLPKYRLDEIKALIPHKTYREIAEVMGCSISAINYYAHKFNLTVNRKGSRNKQIKQLIKQYYGTHSYKEIAEIVGCIKGNILYHIKRMGLKRTKEQLEFLEIKRCQKISQIYQEQKKRNARRLLFGLEPVNKHFCRMAPAKVVRATYYLHKGHGYEYTDDPFVMKRSINARNRKFRCGEEYYTKKYRIRFID